MWVCKYIVIFSEYMGYKRNSGATVLFLDLDLHLI